MKKKIFTVLLVSTLAISMFAGCGKKEKADNTVNVTETATEAEAVKTTVKSDNADITGALGKGVSVDCTEVSNDSEEYKAVEEYLKDMDSTFEVYDINILDKDGAKVQPDGTVEVSIKLSDEMKNSSGNAYVIFHNQGTDFKRIAATEKDGHVTFKTSHFSIYTVVKYDKTDEKFTEKVEAVTEAPTEAPTQESANVAMGTTAQEEQSSAATKPQQPSKENTETPKDEPAQEQPAEPQQPVTPQQPEPEVPSPNPSPEPTPTPEPEQPTQKVYDGYDEFGNGYVIKEDKLNRYLKYFDADNPYTLDQMVWKTDMDCVAIVKDLGECPGDDFDQWRLLTAELEKEMEEMFNAGNQHGYFSSAKPYGNYNGHWIVEYQIVDVTTGAKYLY